MQGLPCRIFVDKHVSSYNFAIEKVALALYFRKQVMSSPQFRDRADHLPRPMTTDHRLILPRAMQTEVWNEVYATWQREEGQHWRALIHEDHREITLYLLKQKLKQYFKTHCFYTYGGDWWFRFLIAVGEVPRALSVLAPRPARCPCFDAGRGPVGAA